MQNPYVGDVADFGKHGLLRFLSGMTDEAGPEPKLKLGLVYAPRRKASARRQREGQRRR